MRSPARHSQSNYKLKNTIFYMQAKDYYKLPKLRFIATKEIEQILRQNQTLNHKDISANNRWRYLKGRRSIPITYLFEDPKVLDEITKLNPTFVTHGGTYSKLPTQINNDIAYLCGLISGDGNLFTTTKRDYIVSVHNKERTLLKKAIQIFKDNFSYSTKIKQGHYCWKVEVRSEVIHSFLNTIMEIESGAKQNIIIPKKIKSSTQFIQNFIAGFFDAEGSVHLQKNNMTCQISFAQKQTNILQEIQTELELMNIETKLYSSTKTCHSLYGNKSSLAPFLEKIPFIHPEKRRKLKMAIKNQRAFSACCSNPKQHSLSSTC